MGTRFVFLWSFLSYTAGFVPKQETAKPKWGETKTYIRFINYVSDTFAPKPAPIYPFKHIKDEPN